MSKEIRLRDVRAETMKNAEQLESFYGQSTITGAVEMAINSHIYWVERANKAEQELRKANYKVEKLIADRKNVLTQIKLWEGKAEQAMKDAKFLAKRFGTKWIG